MFFKVFIFWKYIKIIYILFYKITSKSSKKSWITIPNATGDDKTYWYSSRKKDQKCTNKWTINEQEHKPYCQSHAQLIPKVHDIPKKQTKKSLSWPEDPSYKKNEYLKKKQKKYKQENTIAIYIV